MRKSMRITALALALATGLTGAAQAENFNIFSASKAQAAQENGTLEQVRRYHGGRRWHGGRYYRGHRHWNPGVGFAIGTMGLIAGAAAANSYYDRRYYCDPYYEYCGPRYRRYYAPRYYAPRRYYYYD
jgi:hypothetical protein